MNPIFWAIAISRQDGSEADGIHLLWTAPPAAGYSVKGYDIQRRNAKHRAPNNCYTLTPADFQKLYTDMRVKTPVAMVGVRVSACPAFPDKVPDEPFQGCIDFGKFALGSGPNPRTEQGVSFRVRERTGNPAANTRIQEFNGFRGLDCGFVLEITLPVAAAWVELTLRHTAIPARSIAFNTDATPAGDVTMSGERGQPETIRFEGKAINKLFVTAPQNETLLLKLCFGKAERPIEPAKLCVDFGQSKPGRMPIPLRKQGISFEAQDPSGRPLNANLVQNFQQHRGLDCGFKLIIQLPSASSFAELTLLHTALPAHVEAFNRQGAKVGAQAMRASQGEPETLRIDARSITRLVVNAPQDETLLLKLCIEQPAQTGDQPSVANEHIERLLQEFLSDTSAVNQAAPLIIAELPEQDVDLTSAISNLKFDLHSGANFATAAATVGFNAITHHSTPVCLMLDVDLGEAHNFVSINIGVPAVFAIALREGKAIETRFLSVPGGPQTMAFVNRYVDRVLLYVGVAARQLTICVDAPDGPRADEREWSTVPFIVRGIQLPVRAVNPALANASDERNLATSRLLPSESFDSGSFGDVARVMNDAAANAAIASPVWYTMKTRERLEDPFIELRPWPFALSLITDATWRRLLGFGYLDKGSGLIPGNIYDYRITGYFRRRDIEEELYGFHTIPLGTTLPQSFHLGPLLLNTFLPSRVELFPPTPDSSLTGTGRKGIALHSAIFFDESLSVTFPEPVRRVVLEFEPTAGHDLTYEAKPSEFISGLFGTMASGIVPALPRVEFNFPAPIDMLTLKGSGFLYGIRIVNSPFVAMRPSEGAPIPGPDPNELIPSSVTLYNVRYEPTSAPQSPLFLGTANLQAPIIPGDPGVTVKNPPNSLGFRLQWVPPISGLSIPVVWPPDLGAFPPFDVVGFQLERRRVDVSSPFIEVDQQTPHTLFFGNRSSRKDPPQLCYGINLLELFPEVGKPEPPVPIFMEAEDVLVSAAKSGPPPGSLHQYRIFSVDAIGRRSVVPRVGSIVRLEKHLPPPQPTEPTTPASSPTNVQPSGVRARILQSSDPQMTAADIALLGASANAVVLEWGWTDLERTRDPFATEFRVYWQPVPPDVITGTLVGAATSVSGRYRMTAQLNQPVAADAMVGRYIRAGDYPFRVASHSVGQTVTIDFELSSLDSTKIPSPASFEFRPVLNGSELRPSAWPERTAVVPITASDDYQFVFRDRLTLNANHSRVSIWVGASTADSQSYILDELPASALNGGRPGNESSIATATAKARYFGRPVFTVPPPLPDVPEQVTAEPGDETVSVTLNLGALLPTVSIPVNHLVRVERIGIDSLIARISARSDDTIGVRLPDGSTHSYTLANPTDQADFLSQIRTGTPGRVENRFLMDMLIRELSHLESLWHPCTPQPIPFATLVDLLPNKAERYIYRIRLVDAAGHVSSGSALLPQVVRVPSLRSPAAPDIKIPNSNDDTLSITAVVHDEFDVKWILLFALTKNVNDPLDEQVLEKPQLLRLPNRRDLYPNDGIRLRLRDGTLLSPTSFPVSGGTAQPPNRMVTATLTQGFDKRVAVWGVAMTRDGITSRFVGPRTALTGPLPLVMPALTVTAAAGEDQASWTALVVPAEISIERSTDGGANFSRVSPWLPETQTGYHIAAPGTGSRQYRLVLRRKNGQTVTSPVVTVT